jgi:hypothetical protein
MRPLARAAALLDRARKLGFGLGDYAVPARALRGEKGDAGRDSFPTAITPDELIAMRAEDEADERTREVFDIAPDSVGRKPEAA